MNDIVTVGNKQYVRLGDKLFEIDRFDGEGNPVIKTRSEQITHADGRKDCTVHVSCLKIAAGGHAVTK